MASFFVWMWYKNEYSGCENGCVLCYNQRTYTTIGCLDIGTRSAKLQMLVIIVPSCSSFWILLLMGSGIGPLGLMFFSIAYDRYRYLCCLCLFILLLLVQTTRKNLGCTCVAARWWWTDDCCYDYPSCQPWPFLPPCSWVQLNLWGIMFNVHNNHS